MQPSHHNKMLCEPNSNLNPKMDCCQRILLAQPIHFFEAAYRNRIYELSNALFSPGSLSNDLDEIDYRRLV
jgi:hypothetical protein